MKPKHNPSSRKIRSWLTGLTPGQPVQLSPEIRPDAIQTLEILLMWPESREEHLKFLNLQFADDLPIRQDISIERLAEIADGQLDCMRDDEIVTVLLSRRNLYRLWDCLDDLMPNWWLDLSEQSGREFAAAILASPSDRVRIEVRNPQAIVLLQELQTGRVERRPLDVKSPEREAIIENPETKSVDQPNP